MQSNNNTTASAMFFHTCTVIVHGENCTIHYKYNAILAEFICCNSLGLLIWNFVATLTIKDGEKSISSVI